MNLWCNSIQVLSKMARVFSQKKHESPWCVAFARLVFAEQQPSPGENSSHRRRPLSCRRAKKPVRQLSNQRQSLPLSARLKQFGVGYKIGGPRDFVRKKQWESLGSGTAWNLDVSLSPCLKVRCFRLKILTNFLLHSVAVGMSGDVPFVTALDSILVTLRSSLNAPQHRRAVAWCLPKQPPIDSFDR